jgi:hypothetical protein
MSDPTSAPDGFARRWVADYDQLHEPFEVQDLGPAFFLPRYILGINPDLSVTNAYDPAPDVIWQIPEPMTIETRVFDVDPEVLEILFGGPVIALCDRQIPGRGTE